jgi:hypothetical protein
MEGVYSETPARNYFKHNASPLAGYVSERKRWYSYGTTCVKPVAVVRKPVFSVYNGQDMGVIIDS